MRSKTQTPFVRPDGAVELHPETAVHLHFTCVVDPGYPELDDTLRLSQPLQQSCLFILGVLFDHLFQGTKNLFYGLNELGLAGIPTLYVLDDSLDVCVHTILPKISLPPAPKPSAQMRLSGAGFLAASSYHMGKSCQ